jgi:hypothetical protein
MQQRLILIVEEDEAVRNSLRFSLGLEGFSVRPPDPALRARAAASGVSVIEKPLLDFTLIDKVRRSVAGSPGLHIRP